VARGKERGLGRERWKMKGEAKREREAREEMKVEKKDGGRQVPCRELTILMLDSFSEPPCPSRPQEPSPMEEREPSYFTPYMQQLPATTYTCERETTLKWCGNTPE
jgi:hypothetical protein